METSETVFETIRAWVYKTLGLSVTDDEISDLIDDLESIQKISHE